ncbi:VP4 [Gokushovirus WZ-2015a]|nr:VP4 [Gokushovirus WZ-2015a]
MCTKPSKGFIISDDEFGKELKIFPYDTTYVSKHNSKFVPHKEPLRRQSADQIYTKFIEIPCGACLQCRLKRSKMWADRCLMESQYHTNNWFLTLTYDEQHLPTEEYIHEDTGELLLAHSLQMRDLQLFLKRLRRHFNSGISYLACGEYGPKTARPHYHIILFSDSVVLSDLRLYRQQPNGMSYYMSETLDNIWQNGGVIIGSVTYESCAYVARYVLKKQTGRFNTEETYKKHHIVPEFNTMSKRPAIGRRFYEDHKEELYSMDFISVSTPTGSKKVTTNPYFDKLYAEEHPEKMMFIKLKRMNSAIETAKQKLNRTDLDYMDYLDVEEANLESRFVNFRDLNKEL